MIVSVLLVAFVALCSAERDDNIIGGEEASVGAYPYQCSLQVQGQHICGCSVISNKWIISAAHCFSPMGMPDSVVVGLHDLTNWNVGKPVRHNLDKINRHEGFRMWTLLDDIAVASVVGTIDLSSPYVKTITLAPAGASYDNQQGVITGWGYMDGMRSTNTLQTATVNMFSSSYCNTLWGGQFKSTTMVCLGVRGEKGACMGDSGGPVAVGNVLVGLTSFGPSDCNTQMPSVYTRVAGYRDWIKQHSGL